MTAVDADSLMSFMANGSTNATVLPQTTPLSGSVSPDEDQIFDFDFEDYFNNLNLTDFNVTFPDFVRPEIRPIQIVLLLSYGLVFLLGVPGNALVVWVTGFRMTRSVNSVWFLNLAVADLLCCLSLPLLMVPLAHDDHWHFGAVACTLVKGLFFLVMYCSVLLLVVISLDRLLLVVRPVWCQNYRRPRQASAVCVGVWCLALLASVPQFAYSKQIKAGKLKRECVVSYTPPSAAWVITCFCFLFGFLFPFLLIVVSHLVVYKKVVPGGSSKSSGARTKRTVRVIVAVAMSFFLCWLPLNVLDFIYLQTDPTSDHAPAIYLTHSLTVCLAYLNSCINPLLYVCLGRGFKETMGRSLRSVFNFISEEHSAARPSITTNYTRSTKRTVNDTTV